MNSPPSTLGKYQIIREIARSNDIVYEAWDQQMNRRVAVKELAFPNGLSDTQREDRVSRFKREARAAGSLAHPNIMTVYEVGEDGNRHFIAMEYLDGTTLRKEIDSNGFLPVEKSVDIAISVLRGLAFAHMNGVIHRDIKPDNIQILSDGRIKITDFGIARLTFEPNLTIDGQVFGTPSYMSPEQVVGKEIDARSDLFSVGIMLYEMISGTKPFGGDSVVAITFAIMNKEPDQPPQIPYGIWQVLRKCLDKSPALRQSSAEELLTELERAQQAPQGYADPYNQQNNNPYATNSFYPGAAPPVAFQPPPAAFQPPPAYGMQPPPMMMNPGLQAPIMQQPTGFGQPIPTMPAPSGFVPPPAAPVYYPPPPRAPLFRPETRYMFGRVFLAICLVVALFALVIAVINGIAGAINNGQAINSSEIRTASNDQVPLKDRIDAAEKARGSDNQVERDLAKAELSDLYHKQADAASADPKAAAEVENSYRMAVENNPTNPIHYYSLAQQLQQRAASLEVPKERARVLSEVVSNYQTGLRYEADQLRRKEKQNAMAKALYEQAIAIAEDGDKGGARDLLYKAKRVLEQAPDLEQQINSLLAKLT